MGGLIASYRVYVDGRRAGRLGRGRTRSYDLTPGQHSVRIAILYCDSTYSVRVAPGEEVTLTCRARPYNRGDVVTHRHDWVLIDEVGRSRAARGRATGG